MFSNKMVKIYRFIYGIIYGIIYSIIDRFILVKESSNNHFYLRRHVQ